MSDAERTLSHPEAPVKLVVSIPCGDTVQAEFMISLAQMMGYMGASAVADGLADIALHVERGSLIANSRNSLVAGALRKNATHILFIDSDMRFPRNAALRLLNHNKPVVGVTYATRRVPPLPVGYQVVGENDAEQSRIVVTPESTGLEQVGALGFGLILIRTEVFYGLGYPPFQTCYNQDQKRWYGEDVYFCQKATEKGVPIYVDHDLSKEVAHVGTFAYTLDHVHSVADEVVAAREELTRDK